MAVPLAMHTMQPRHRTHRGGPTCFAAATVRSVHFLLDWGAARNGQVRWLLPIMACEEVD